MEIASSGKCYPRRSMFMLCTLVFCFLFLCALYSLSTRTKHSLVFQDFGYTNTGAAFRIKSSSDQPAGSSTAQRSTTVAKSFSNNQIRRVLTSHPSSATCTNATLSPPKLILLWTSFFGSWTYLPRGPYKHCSQCTNCQLTTDRQRLTESDAVVFHVRDIALFDLPKHRLPRQVWVFYSLEAPPYSNFPGLDYMNYMFNWTMTYRSDSDIFAPYGMVEKVAPKKRLDKSLLFEQWKNKKSSVVWMSSHCPTDGARDDYVAHLKKYIDVDIYGSCGYLKCPKTRTKLCLRKFEQQYMFFLAFENSICKDYVTEKFFEALQYDMVPVVFGGAKYKKHAPPCSYVDALSFRSPKHLAFYLTQISKNFSLYSAYFRWKEDHVVHLTNKKECDLCNRLHSNNHATSTYKDIRKWWVDDSKCHAWKDKFG